MTDVFNAPDNSVVAVTPLSALVGPDKKFKTVDDLAKGKTESDAYIEQLKGEAVELRAIVDRKEQSDAVLTELRNEVARLKQGSKDSAQPSRENTTPGLSEADVKNLVERHLTDAEKGRTVAQNINRANDEMIVRFGTKEKAVDAVRVKAAELAISVDKLRDVAAESPSAFLQLMGASGQPAQSSVGNLPIGTMNSQSNASGHGPKDGTKAYWDAFRKTQGDAKYFKPAIQNRIFEDKKSGTYDN